MESPAALPTLRAPLSSIERVCIWAFILIDIWSTREILSWQCDGLLEESIKWLAIFETPFAFLVYFMALYLDISLTEALQVVDDLLDDI